MCQGTTLQASETRYPEGGGGFNPCNSWVPHPSRFFEDKMRRVGKQPTPSHHHPQPYPFLLLQTSNHLEQMRCRRISFRPKHLMQRLHMNPGLLRQRRKTQRRIDEVAQNPASLGLSPVPLLRTRLTRPLARQQRLDSPASSLWRNLRSLRYRSCTCSRNSRVNPMLSSPPACPIDPSRSMVKHTLPSSLDSPRMAPKTRQIPSKCALLRAVSCIFPGL